MIAIDNVLTNFFLYFYLSLSTLGGILFLLFIFNENEKKISFQENPKFYLKYHYQKIRTSLSNISEPIWFDFENNLDLNNDEFKSNINLQIKMLEECAQKYKFLSNYLLERNLLNESLDLRFQNHLEIPSYFYEELIEVHSNLNDYQAARITFLEKMRHYPNKRNQNRAWCCNSKY